MNRPDAYRLEFRAQASDGQQPFVAVEYVAVAQMNYARVNFSALLEIHAEKARKTMLRTVEVMGHSATPLLDKMTFKIEGEL